MFVAILKKPSEGSTESLEYQNLGILGLNADSESEFSRNESAMLVYGVLL